MPKKSSKLTARYNMFDENGIDLTHIENNDDVIFELINRAKTIHDVRHESYIWHRLEDIEIPGVALWGSFCRYDSHCDWKYRHQALLWHCDFFSYGYHG